METRISELVEHLNDPEPMVRLGAVAKLRDDIASPARACLVPALTECLKDENLDVCVVAAGALGKIGHAAGAAIPALAGAVRHPDSLLSWRAAKTLSDIYRSVLLDNVVGPDADVAVQALTEVLMNTASCAGVCHVVVFALGDIGCAAAEGLVTVRNDVVELAAQAVTKRLEDPDDEVRFDAERSLPYLRAAVRARSSAPPPDAC